MITKSEISEAHARALLRIAADSALDIPPGWQAAEGPITIDGNTAIYSMHRHWADPVRVLVHVRLGEGRTYVVAGAGETDCAVLACSWADDLNAETHPDRGAA